jgi:hypothetical protein
VKERSAVAGGFGVREGGETIEETQTKELTGVLPGNAADELCPETNSVVVHAAAAEVVVVAVVVEVEVDEDDVGANLAGPAEPYCAAALPATDAAGVVVLYMLNLPYYRPVRWVLGWASTSPGI